MANSDIPSTFNFMDGGFSVEFSEVDMFNSEISKMTISLDGSFSSATPLLRDEFLAAVWAFQEVFSSHLSDGGVEMHLTAPRVFLPDPGIETEDPAL